MPATRYTVQRSEHTYFRGWVKVAKVKDSLLAFRLADQERRMGQPCRVLDSDLNNNPVYVTR